MTDIYIYDSHEKLQKDAQFLCSHEGMDTELVDRLVLQLNRIYPQILSDKEAHRFRNLSVPTKVRLAELLKHLYVKGEEACHEFYRGLHIHAEDVYTNLPTTVRQRDAEDRNWTSDDESGSEERYVLNDKGPMFFLSCFTFLVGVAMLYYYRDDETLKCTGPFYNCSAAISKGAKDALIFYTEA